MFPLFGRVFKLAEGIQLAVLCDHSTPASEPVVICSFKIAIYGKEDHTGPSLRTKRQKERAAATSLVLLATSCFEFPERRCFEESKY